MQIKLESSIPSLRVMRIHITCITCYSLCHYTALLCVRAARLWQISYYDFLTWLLFDFENIMHWRNLKNYFWHRKKSVICTAGSQAFVLKPTDTLVCWFFQPIRACHSYISISIHVLQYTLIWKQCLKARKKAWTMDLKWCNKVVYPADGSPLLNN